jgi:hypothetical protein
MTIANDQGAAESRWGTSGNGAPTDHSNVKSHFIKQYCNATFSCSEVASCIRSAERYAGPEAEIPQPWIESLRRAL